MRYYKLFLAAAVPVLAAIFYFGFEQTGRQTAVGGWSDGMDDDPQARGEWMQKMLADPATGKIPADVRSKELAFAATLPVDAAKYKANADNFWFGRGPWNVGGRTRAIAIDKTNENVLLTGGASGGIWRSTDGGGNWTKLGPDSTLAPVTAIVQDTRTGKTNTWYAGTGEYYGGYVPGATYLGKGILKSTDGGLTWHSLSSTSSGTPQSFDNTWDFIHNVVINPAIDSIDVVYAAQYDGVYRSLNGGQTWSKRRGGGIGTGSSVWTDVAVTPSGIVYATLSSGGGQAGIWRSNNNGNTWVNITPAGFPVGFGRIVIGVAPSDETQVYFVAHTPNGGKKSVDFQGREDWNSFWKYTFISGDGSGTGGSWENRSANLPGFGGDFGDFNSQQGYCLYVKVKPDNPDFVFVGAANLYKSTDGFKTTANSSWAGGYYPNTSRPNYDIYPDHHPDQHNMVFYPSNPKKCISVHDGGISRCTDNTADSIGWQQLNGGYVTTQFYTVAIDHATTGSNIVIGGLQDNGTHFTNSDNILKPWTMPSTSDGGFCFVMDGATDYLMSAQQGRVYRVQLDASGNRVLFARLDPAGVPRSQYQFINPYAVDGGNWKRLYVPANNRLWRNSDITAIPLKSVTDTNRVLTNWFRYSTNLGDTTDEITAITSAGKIADVLYYGTMKGGIYKMRGASQGDPAPDYIGATNMPGAYINCIAVHPEDTSKLFVVYTNYSVQSVFYTTDGGSNWVPVSGNLEQNANGSGNGPSCRWLTIAKVNGKYTYFLGTSTGLYATDSINGMNTKWILQSPQNIGNNIVTMMDYRISDGLMAVSTFGAGMFSAHLNNAHNITGVNKTLPPVAIRYYPNPVVSTLHIELKEPERATVEVYAVNGSKEISTTISGKTLQLDVADLPRGIHLVRVAAGNGEITIFRILKE